MKLSPDQCRTLLCGWLVAAGKVVLFQFSLRVTSEQHSSDLPHAPPGRCMVDSDEVLFIIIISI